MGKLYWLIFGATLLQGFFVHAKESIPPASEKLGTYYYQRALELGQPQAQEALKFAASLGFVARELNDVKSIYNALKLERDLYRHTENYKQAFFWLQQAFNTAKANSGTLNLVMPYHNLGAVFQNTLKRNELLHNTSEIRSEYQLDQRDQRIEQLKPQAEMAISGLLFTDVVVGFLLVLVLMLVGLVIFFVLKLRKASRLNNLLKNNKQLILSQKQEIEEQHGSIHSKNIELENARTKNEEYFNELLREKDELEERVRVGTKELEETYQRLSLHINTTSLAVLEWSAGKELVHWPKQAEVIFGFTAEEVLGLRMNEVPFIQPEERKELIEMVDQLYKGELTRQHFTRKGINRYGGPCFIEWSFSLLLNAEGEPETVLSVASDVSFREQTFRELKDANQELDTFLYKSSHDLRGPIARMQGIINLGLLESKDEQARLYFNMLNKVTDELNNVLLRLLMVHNINQHSFKLESIPFASFIDKVILTHTHNRVSFKDVKINNKVPADLVVKSDQTLLNIIIVNLLENGMKFADNFNPVIEIDAVYLPSGKYIISVTDNGVGIPEEYREKVFDMFFQGSTRSTSTGLGLYMVRKAAKRLGGEIQLLSGNGQTIFEIILPAERSSDMAKVKMNE